MGTYYTSHPILSSTIIPSPPFLLSSLSLFPPSLPLPLTSWVRGPAPEIFFDVIDARRRVLVNFGNTIQQSNTATFLPENSKFGIWLQ